MDDEEESTTNTPNVKLEYFINNEGKKEDLLNFSYLNFVYDRISYENITFSFYIFFKYFAFDKEKRETPEEFIDIKQDNIKYEFIRYFDGDGWILLNEKEFIFLDDKLTFNNLKIMIKANISTEEQIDVEKQYDNINKQFNYIENELKEINYNYFLPPDYPLNLVVLTANPLMDNGKELRTMNDFNIITSEIYNILNEEDYLNGTEFFLLTQSTLKEVITNEQKIPIILHLICKSTYIIEEEKDDYAYLIFEKDYNSNSDKNNYNVDYVGKTKLKEEIFNFEKNPKIKKIIEKITLLISTPLAEDFYDIFKDFGFKNILVQHTTLADVKYIAEFNKTFYKSIISHSSHPLNLIYEEALNTDIDKIYLPKFCCCLHKHKRTCDFVKNIQNEIYNNNYSQNLEKLDYQVVLGEIAKTIPHFNHLMPECPYQNKTCKDVIKEININSEIKYPENSFSLHCNVCFKKFHYKEIEPYRAINKKFYNICCCNEEPKIHTIDYAFLKDFTPNEKNNQIRFKIPEILNENKYIPKYNKMELLVGKNNFVLQVLKFFFSYESFLNVWGDNIENLKKFGKIIKEYYLERYHFYEYNRKLKKEKDEKKKLLKKTVSFPNLNKIVDENELDEDLKAKEIKSSPALMRVPKIKNEIIEINLNRDNDIILNNEQKNNNDNIIYFIYVYDAELVNKVKLGDKIKIVWFSEDPLNNINKKIKLTKEPTYESEKFEEYYRNLKKVKINEYIKFQNEKDVINSWRKKIK